MAAAQNPCVKITLLYFSTSVFKQKILELVTLFAGCLNNILYKSQSI